MRGQFASVGLAQARPNKCLLAHSLYNIIQGCEGLPNSFAENFLNKYSTGDTKSKENSVIVCGCSPLVYSLAWTVQE